MFRAILVDVRQLHQAAKEEKKRKQRYEPNTSLRIRRPQFAHSPLIPNHYTSGLENCQFLVFVLHSL